MAPNQIQEREQENPHDIDEVPIEAADFNRTVVFRRDRAAPRPPEHPAHDAEADDHMQRVESGHNEVQRKEQLRVPHEFLLELERRTGHMMLGELVVVLDTLDSQKYSAQNHRQNEECDQEL